MCSTGAHQPPAHCEPRRLSACVLAKNTAQNGDTDDYRFCSYTVLVRYFLRVQKNTKKSESARRLENAERGTLSRPTTNKRDTRCIIIQLLPAAKATQQLTAHSNARTRSTMPSSPVAPSGMMMDRESAYRECSVCNEHKKIFAQGKCKVCWSKVRLRAPVYPLNP